jgi:hypothetical protein
VYTVLRNLTLAVGLTAFTGALGGCAGINELSNGELLNPLIGSNAGGMQMSGNDLSGSASFSQSAGMTGSQAQSNVRVGVDYQAGMEPASTQQILTSNDPINAPPPPLTGPTEMIVPIPDSRPSAGGRPLMLVPPPGTDMSSMTATTPVQESVVSIETTASSQPLAPNSVRQEFIPTPVAPPARPVEPQTVVVTSQSMNTSMRGREFVPASISQSGLVSSSLQPGEIPLTQAQINTLRRFEVLDLLLAQGLVTQQEYSQRRTQNVGAILPYSHDAPAIGLQREVPSGEAISSRLGALKRSLEMRAITPRQHSLERSMILDALLPSNPRNRATPAPPPTDVISAAAMIGQLERLRFEGVISDAEFERERSAIDRYVQSGTLIDEAETASNSTGADNQKAQENVVATSMPSSNLGIHLASYRSEAAAQSGWKNLQSKYAGQLGGLSPVVRRVNLGENRGTFYRLFAGPVSNTSQANSICQQLKRSNQYCDPLKFDS